MADKYTELAELFVLGALPENETQELVQHLATGCQDCRRAVEDARRVLSLLPYAAPQSDPPPELKQRLLDAVATETKTVKTRPAPEKNETAKSGPATIRSMPQRTFTQRLQGTLAWAAVFLLVAVSYGYFLQRNLIGDLRQQIAAQEQQLQESHAEIKLLSFELERQKTVIEQIKKSNAPRLLLVDLKGTEVKPSGSVKILLDPQTAGGSFIAYNLPPLTDDQDYQLWFLKDGKPFDAGVFHVDANGQYIGEVQHLPATLAGIAAFAITKEPKGGRPQPTMPIYWVGSVQGV